MQVKHLTRFKKFECK